MAHSRPSSPGCSHAMSSPTVNARQPGSEAGGISMARLVFLQAHDQHVLGEPALGARLPAGDTQRVALLAEQRVAAVTGAEALDRQLLGKVHDETALGIELADGVQPAHEPAVV